MREYKIIPVLKPVGRPTRYAGEHLRPLAVMVTQKMERYLNDRIGGKGEYLRKLIEKDMTENANIFRCEECDEPMINGTIKHEANCPNINNRYEELHGAMQWVPYLECDECGTWIREGTGCLCLEE